MSQELDRIDDDAIEEIVRKWLSYMLETEYLTAEKDYSRLFLEVLSEDSSVVEDLLFELGLADLGYEVRSELEVAAYVKWLRTGDWRFGSEPLPPLPGEICGDFGAIGHVPMTTDRSGLDLNTLVVEHACLMEQECACTGNGKKLADSIESLATLEKELIREECHERKKGIEQIDELLKRFENLTAVTDRFKATSRRGSLHETTSDAENPNPSSPRSAQTGESNRIKLNPRSPEFIPATLYLEEDEECLIPGHNHSNSQRYYPVHTPPPQHRLPYTPVNPFYNFTPPVFYPPTTSSTPTSLYSTPYFHSNSSFQHSPILPPASSFHHHHTASYATPGFGSDGREEGDDEVTIEYDPAEWMGVDEKKGSCALRLHTN
jgi:hypothetical protein